VNLEFEFLFDRPEFVTQVISWWHTEWADRMGDNLEPITTDFCASLSKNELPLDIIALLDGQPIGTAALKLHEMSDVFPDYKYWLGSVFVAPEHRGKGVAARLTNQVVKMAKERNYPQLYLQTAHLTGGLYVTMGWRALHQLNYKNTETLVMVNDSL
jgi:GNAT superfamily N-acetyltransferase